MSVLRSILLVVSLGLVSAILGIGNGENDVKGTIIALERAALDRWGKGDPSGFLALFANEVTYFDPDIERRLNGLDSLRKLLAPLEGKISIERYEMIHPKVQIHGETAVLTYNLTDYVRASDGSLTSSRWNSTEVYRRVDGKWKIIHSHWSQPKSQEEK